MKGSEMVKKYVAMLSGILLLFILYLTSRSSYLLFHSLVEIFSIVIAFCIFIIVWNSQRFLDNGYLQFVGIAYLFVGIIDLLHTLAYKGMGVFQGYDANLPTQLWIVGSYFQSLSLAIAPFFLGRKPRIHLIAAGFGAAAFLLLISIFHWGIFPDCFIEGVGLTPFKKVSEYIICSILLISLVLLLHKGKEFDKAVLRFLLLSILLTIGTELAFTFYIDVYGFLNLVGHFLKVLSFYLIYKALVETGLRRPYDLLFRNLRESEGDLRRAKEDLEIKVAERTEELGVANEKLRHELAERGRTEQVLQRSADEIQDLYNRAPCGYHSLDEDGLFIRMNDTELQWLGYRKEEVVGKLKFSDLLTPKGLETFKDSFPRLKARGSVSDVAFNLIRKDGSLLPVLLSATAIRDNAGRYVMSRSMIYDMTDHNRAQEALGESEKQLRHLSSQLLRAHESERKRIAAEIHDGLGQSLSLIKYRVEALLEEMSKGPAKNHPDTLRSLVPMIQGSIEEARRIQMGLRPSILDDLGVIATLHWFCREFEKTYSQIHINKEVDIGEEEIPERLKTTIYRVTQEALNNIAKHSKADLVDLSLTRMEDRIELVIQDNGKGFDPEVDLSRQSSPKGLGLTSMTERAGLSGGSIAIVSRKEAGTMIRVSWPMEEPHR